MAPDLMWAASVFRDISDSNCSRVASPPLEENASSINMVSRVFAAPRQVKTPTPICG
jgi:hypothetical protein